MCCTENAQALEEIFDHWRSYNPVEDKALIQK